ncbi:MAG: ferrochelatase [Candidatus Koribacter versatilis]|uniref:Ferrochelatase n=1 Tax=Candidatus Korobacter versatilis TaxID=658062 RepID=A0A932ENK5_9BACT|nr:ferrochelatase [Candidatus Koribacter versatilis]
MAEDKRRTGVVLFQLGGPDSLQAIEPFLFNLFCDPDIIDFPFARLGRRPLAKLISTTRAKHVEHHYQVIGGCSPIRRHTEQQARALEAELRREGIDAVCVVAMRYWYPFTQEAIAQLRIADVDEVILLPMYPQYSTTTTGSSLNEWERKTKPEWPTEIFREFYTHPGYLESICEKIESTLARFPHPEQAELVFSAHSVPVAVIAKGDPYQRQIEETVALVMQRGGWRNPHRLCYQSKVGASKWLQPSLRTTVRDMAAANIKDVCIVPIAFVSDHVETLGEIDHEARAQAMSLGIRQFEMTPGLNDSPTFIRALADLVLECVRPPATAIENESLMAAD